ncbi:hypothetical protein E4198_22785 [Streptomyces sp. RKND-216]|uniref:hypothetical protein n=1 Tax=Streptomyces sp. RKND-216 TaxID=2562581 RepID=UPI00109DAF53|nr:hypothetical protein [Streptomyces sp. RKND-216]THA27916.1 hypothetical protein E4198_22785 [Streptomyces sp. RKND-216]
MRRPLGTHGGAGPHTPAPAAPEPAPKPAPEAPAPGTSGPGTPGPEATEPDATEPGPPEAATPANALADARHDGLDAHHDGRPDEEDHGPQPLGVRIEQTGDPDVDAQLQRLEDADHLAVSGHLEVYEDVHRGLRDTLTALDRHDTRS